MVQPKVAPKRAQPMMATARASIRIYDKRRKTLISRQGLETVEIFVASRIFDPGSIYSTAAEELLKANRPLRQSSREAELSPMS
jgi:hypothetical protein